MVAVEVLLSIGILLFTAKIFGEIAERLKVDSLVGEVLAGLLLGPVLFIVKPEAFLEGISYVGVILLVFVIGLETRFTNIKEHFSQGSVLAIIACISSLVGGFAVGVFALGSIDSGIFLGIALMGTSTAIPIKILIGRGEFHSRSSQFLTATSMADDVATMVGLSFLASYFSGTMNPWASVALVFVFVGFIYAMIHVGTKAVGHVLSYAQRLKDSEIMLSVPLAIVFAITFFAENIGIAGIVGAFLAGMVMAESQFSKDVILPKVRTIGYGFFIPIFFAYSALMINLSLLADYWWFIVLLTLAAVLTKVISSGIVASWFGFRARERNIIVAGMIPRGECGIVISQLALSLGVITNQLYGAMIAMILVTVIITPIIFTFALKSGSRYKR